MLPTSLSCSSCNAKNSRTASYCVECGVELSDGDDVPSQQQKESRSAKFGAMIGVSLCSSASWFVGLLPSTSSFFEVVPYIRIALIGAAVVFAIHRRETLRVMMYEWFLSRSFLKGAFTGTVARSQAERTSAMIVAQLVLGVVFLAGRPIFTDFDPTLGLLFSLLCGVAFMVLDAIAAYNFQCVGEHVLNGLFGFDACPSCGRRIVGDTKFCPGCREEARLQGM